MSPFVPGTDIHIEGRPGGPLTGLRFAAKDLFDIAGHPTGGGNPDWARQNPLPTRHAWAVQALLDAGATLIGKTITDEVSLGILGENPFDGTPLNPAAPGHVPGGSSSGSASAVAQGLCETALGTDTGGSVRVPASFCGLYGIRPTHGRMNLAGMLPQAPSSDTTGWFARDAASFARVSEVLLQDKVAEAPPIRLVIAVDAFGFAEAETAAALAPMLERLKKMIPDWREEVLAPPGLVAWGRAQRTLQPVEAWETFREWIERDNPRFAFSVARGLAMGAATPEAERGWAALTRQEVRGRLRHLLPPGTVLAMPTTPFPAPKAGLPLPALGPIRDQILSLCAVGGLAGHPQINLPGATVAGRPVGLSLIAARGADTLLLRAALEMEKA
ncbi:amidase [Falsiroseomonas sp.]|uniref:amidase n=1 Tax=Falsiroseomonas sp. TaxID=2870721 RepID=UPI002736784C|nr:amidase [Falsiroseomonas sp.]MDP3416718.1 amidase [Falsiroseomonas sp.]